MAATEITVEGMETPLTTGNNPEAKPPRITPDTKRRPSAKAPTAPKSNAEPEGTTLFGRQDKSPDPKIIGKHRANVEAALAVMEGAYSLGQMAVLLSNRPLTAQAMAEGLDEVQKQNRQAFEASEKLASTVANLGNVSAIGMFLTGNIMYITTIVMTSRAEAQQKREAVEETTPIPPTGAVL